MFVRYSCGCVGLRIEGQPDITIKSCEDTTELIFSDVRDLSKKEVQPLSPTDVTTLIRELGMQLRDGERYRRLRYLLDIPARTGD